MIETSKLSDKEKFLLDATAFLKQRNYKKRKNYWYLTVGDIIFCIYVQGSCWNKNNYYVNIGAKEHVGDMPYPTELHWTWGYRCFDKNGNQVNISIETLIDCMDKYFNDYISMGKDAFLEKYNAVEDGPRFIITYKRR